jgi:hypothetical protein
MIDVTGIKDNHVMDGCIGLRTTTAVSPIRHSSVEAARLIQAERRCAGYVQAAVVRQQLQAGRAVSVARRQLRNRVVTMNISPTYATHSVEIIRRQPEAGDVVPALRLKEISRLPFFIQPTMECHVCGVPVPVPHGNLKNCAQQLAQEWGDDTMYIAVTLDHVWNTPQPPGTARTLVEKRLVNTKILDGAPIRPISELNDESAQYYNAESH